MFQRYAGSGGELLLALALADEAKDDGSNVRPGVPTLARKARLSEKQVGRLLKKMQADGWLVRISQAHGRGEAGFAEFQISPEWIAGGEVSATMSGQNDRTSCPVNAPMTGHDVRSTRNKAQKTGHDVPSNGPEMPVDKSPLFNIKPPPLYPPKIDNDSENFELVGEPGANDYQRFADWFFVELVKVNAAVIRPRNMQRWERDVRLMVEQDGRALRDSAVLARWAWRDPFWAAVVLSPGKLRAKWANLDAGRERDRKRQAGVVAAGVAVTGAASRMCMCGCGGHGTRSFRTDGTQWYTDACYEREALRREREAA